MQAKNGCLTRECASRRRLGDKRRAGTETRGTASRRASSSTSTEYIVWIASALIFTVYLGPARTGLSRFSACVALMQTRRGRSRRGSSDLQRNCGCRVINPTSNAERARAREDMQSPARTLMRHGPMSQEQRHGQHSNLSSINIHSMTISLDPRRGGGECSRARAANQDARRGRESPCIGSPHRSKSILCQQQSSRSHHGHATYSYLSERQPFPSSLPPAALAARIRRRTYMLTECYFSPRMRDRAPRHLPCAPLPLSFLARRMQRCTRSRSQRRTEKGYRRAAVALYALFSPQHGPVRCRPKLSPPGPHNPRALLAAFGCDGGRPLAGACSSRQKKTSRASPEMGLLVPWR